MAYELKEFCEATVYPTWDMASKAAHSHTTRNKTHTYLIVRNKDGFMVKVWKGQFDTDEVIWL